MVRFTTGWLVRGSAVALVMVALCVGVMVGEGTFGGGTFGEGTVTPAAFAAIGPGQDTTKTQKDKVENKSDAEDPATELLRLRTERRDTLRTLVQLMTAQYRQGNRRFADVMAANRQLLDAELELASTDKLRIQLHRRAIELAKRMEATVEARVRASDAGHDELLVAKAARLAAEIELARLRAAADPGK